MSITITCRLCDASETTTTAPEAKAWSDSHDAACQGLHPATVVNPATSLRTVKAYLAKTLDNIEGDEEPWPAKDVREFITDALAFAAGADPVPAESAEVL